MYIDDAMFPRLGADIDAHKVAANARRVGAQLRNARHMSLAELVDELTDDDSLYQ